MNLPEDVSSRIDFGEVAASSLAHHARHPSRMKLRPYSATILALGGAVLILLGLYFLFVRPPLLPDDLHAMGTTLAQLDAAVPGLAR